MPFLPLIILPLFTIWLSIMMKESGINSTQLWGQKTRAGTRSYPVVSLARSLYYRYKKSKEMMIITIKSRVTYGNGEDSSSSRGLSSVADMLDAGRASGSFMAWLWPVWTGLLAWLLVDRAGDKGCCCCCCCLRRLLLRRIDVMRKDCRNDWRARSTILKPTSKTHSQFKFKWKQQIIIMLHV